MEENKARAPTRCGYFIRLRTLSNKNEENKYEEKKINKQYPQDFVDVVTFSILTNPLISRKSNSKTPGQAAPTNNNKIINLTIYFINHY